MSLSGKFGVKSSAAMLANILLINGLASALFDRTEMHFSRSRPLSFTGAMASARRGLDAAHEIVNQFQQGAAPNGTQIQ
jgi:hypothetical protein